MDLIQEGWFSEINSQWPGQCLSLKVEEVLHQEKSKYQDILIFQSSSFGKVLVLDGVIQVTERDEFAYQEMITHVPVNSHPNPQHVLVIGGGDGGIVRELIKYSSIQTIILCEIDERVIELSKKFLPSLARSFEDPRVKVHIRDGFEFLKNHTNEFDIIITDSSDPIGPAESLFKKEYYEFVKAALKPDGILCSQGECLWLHLDLIKEMITFCEDLFPVVSYAYVPIPSYPSGQIGILLSSKNKNIDFKVPVHKLCNNDMERMKLKCYSSQFHSAIFILPTFAKMLQVPKTIEL